jgi:hypothetical protein
MNSLRQGHVVELSAARRTSGYAIELSFNDGVTQVVDFGPFLQQSSNPLIREYLDPDRFARFAIKNGDLVWDDYGLCFPIADLYENNVAGQCHQVSESPPQPDRRPVKSVRGKRPTSGRKLSRTK